MLTCLTASSESTTSGFSLRSVMHDAQYPSRTIAFQDKDGNPLYISY
jgi:hypothetical protein